MYYFYQDDPVVDPELSTSIGGSRFYQLFQIGRGSQGSQEHSRRSSLNDEFGYLNGRVIVDYDLDC